LIELFCTNDIRICDSSSSRDDDDDDDNDNDKRGKLIMKYFWTMCIFQHHCPLSLPIQLLSHTFTESADTPTSPFIPEKGNAHCVHCNIQMSLLSIVEWEHFWFSALRTLNEVQDGS